MVFQVGLFTEAPVAHVALIRPGPTVDEHVAPQVPWGGERLGTQRALVGLLLQYSKYILIHSLKNINKTSRFSSTAWRILNLQLKNSVDLWRILNLQYSHIVVTCLL